MPSGASKASNFGKGELSNMDSYRENQTPALPDAEGGFEGSVLPPLPLKPYSIPASAVLRDLGKLDRFAAFCNRCGVRQEGQLNGVHHDSSSQSDADRFEAISGLSARGHLIPSPFSWGEEEQTDDENRGSPEVPEISLVPAPSQHGDDALRRAI